MDDGNCDNKGKRKKSLWVRWLSFFRRQFIFKKRKSFHLDEYEEKSLNKGENLNDSNIVSCTSSLDIIEMPTQAGQKISKILIKPTKNGIKAMIAQYDARSLLSLKAKKFPLINELSKLKAKRKQFTGQNAEKLEMTWTRNLKTINSERKEVLKNENSLMSAPYIRQDTDNVESTFFLEPKLSNEYVESKESEYSDQKSIEINGRHVSCRVFNEVTGEATKTFKTVSEPTWSEKEKIFHEQRLQENLNQLLEQFILLQSDDLISFAAAQNRVMEKQKRIRCNGDESTFKWIEGNNKRISKRLSREVSPEILVNIKPFKQYLSRTYINLQEPPIQFVNQKERDATDDQETEMVLKQKFQMQKKSEMLITEKKAEDKNLSHHCPDVRNKLQLFSGTNNNLKVESSHVKTLVSTQSSERKENKNENMSFYILDCDLLAGSNNNESLGVSSGNSKARFANNNDICSVWGVYKSFAKLETVDEKENHTQNEAIDEVLESFDDKDHNLIFKKNMAQFKRKISSKASIFEKNVKLSTEALGELEVKEENVSIKETGCEIQDRFILNLKEKNSLADQNFIKMSSTAALQKIIFFFGYKLKKTLATYNWFLLRQMGFCKTMASRIEVSTIRCSEAFKEINNLFERNIKTVIEKKHSKVSGEETIILRQRNMEDTGFNNDLQCFLNFKNNAKNCVQIALQENEISTQSKNRVLERTNNNQWQANDNASAFMCSKPFLNSTCSSNMLENSSFTNLVKPGVFKPPNLFPIKKSLNETSPVKAKVLNEQNGVNSLKKKGLVFYEISFRQIHKVLEIINDVTVQYHRKEYMSLRDFKGVANNFSSTVIVEKNDQTSVSCSEIFTGDASSLDDKAPITNEISCTGNCKIKSPIQMGEKLDENSTVPMSFQCENLIHELVLRKPIEQRIIGKNRDGHEVYNELKTKSLVDFKFDGIRILYDALNKGCLNDYEDAVTKTVSATSFTMDYSKFSPKFLSSEEKEILCISDDFLIDQKISMMNVTDLAKDNSNLNKPQEKLSRCLTQEVSKIGISNIIRNKNRSILLKYRSCSSPKEYILKSDHNMHEHRMIRSLNFVKDMEKFDFNKYKKKRVFTEKGADTRRTDTASLETLFAGKLEKNKSFITSLLKEESLDADIKLKTPLAPNELQALRETQYKSSAGKPGLNIRVTKIFSKEQKMSSSYVISDKKLLNTENERTKMYILEKNGVSVGKEIVAAFNSIKNFTPCRKEAEEGNKRMSLVVMLFRNK